ncbi:MAG: C40 family peptidase [Armatimonadetes bacterium]|nr:C40 family peptidase [Armatimonadota bacterium]
MPADGCYSHGPYDNDDHPSTGCHPACYDCSGFAWKLLSYVGVPISQGPSASQYTQFPDVGDSYKTGDLLFLGSTPGSIHHVMVAGSAGGSDYYEAPYTGQWTRGSSGGHDYASGPSGNGWCMDDDCGH